MNTEQNENLLEYGAIQSGLNRGSEVNLKSFLDQILTGKLVDKSIRKDKTQDEKDKLTENALTIEKQIVDLEGSKSNLENNLIPSIEKEIRKLGEDKYTLPRDETFRLSKFIVLILSWILVTAFLLFFYSSMAVNAFSKPFLKDSLHLLSLKEIINTIVHNPGLLLVPSIFLALGVFLHYILDKKDKMKWVVAGVVILFTLILDFVIALYIHDKVSNYPGLDEVLIKPWYLDIKFYIIMVMGFLVYILWSGVFHGWMEELSKRDITGKINQKIIDLETELEKQRTNLNSIISQINSKNLDIANINREKDIVKFSKSDIKHSIDQFSTGWLQPLSFESQIPLKLKCESIIQEFRNKIGNEDL
ncbi:MAG: hypothetical protein M3Q58_06840 [Bacteroidota bacterium]|nr:hypothetical protein [Bacteroidota bacterium]